MRKFLYIGGFVLPDKNAAAQRVVSIAKSIKTLEYEVVFLNYSKECTHYQIQNYFGFKTYEYPKQSKINQLTNIKDIKDIIIKESITDIIAYNMPAVALSKIIKFCKHNKLRIYADVTEWYIADGNLIFKIIKTLDTEYRMRILHKKVDGIIAISSFVSEYYKNVKNVIIPTTIDITDKKWQLKQNKNTTTNNLIYAGTPSARKEKLKLVVDAVESVGKTHNLHLNIIGITKEQYEDMYSTKYNGKYTSFLGRIPHNDVLKIVADSNYSIIIRDNNKVVKAGFPTKLSESFACGTPVIINNFSDIKNYVTNENGIITEIKTLEDTIIRSCTAQLKVDVSLFDYHNFLNKIKELIA